MYVFGFVKHQMFPDLQFNFECNTNILTYVYVLLCLAISIHCYTSSSYTRFYVHSVSEIKAILHCYKIRMNRRIRCMVISVRHFTSSRKQKINDFRFIFNDATRTSYKRNFYT